MTTSKNTHDMTLAELDAELATLQAIDETTMTVRIARRRGAVLDAKNRINRALGKRPTPTSMPIPTTHTDAGSF